MSVRDIIQAAAGVGGGGGDPEWELDNATYRGIPTSSSIATYETTPTDVKFNNDGTRMYVLGTSTDAVLQYNLGTAYKPSTAVFPGKSVAAEELTPNGVEFKPDGTKMYVIGTTGDDVNQYDLSTAWDVTTASYVQSFSVSAQAGAAPTKVRFKDDGTRMFVLSNTNDTVFQYTLTSAWDISTASYDSISFGVAGQESDPSGMFFGDSGAKMYIVGRTNDTVYQYTLSTPWDLSTASYASLSKSISAEESNPFDVFFKSDGTVMYIIGTTGDDVNQYALSSAWDVSTASYTKVSSPTLSAWFGESAPVGMYIKPDGTQFYAVGTTTDTVWQQTMPTAWDVANMVPGFYVGSQEGTPNGLAFKDDGTKMYIVGSGNDTVYQYSLSTAWDVFTASYDSVSFSVASQELEPNGVTFKTDGTKMYIIGQSGDDVNEYNLGTAWNVSTASYVQNFSVSAQTGAIPVKVEFSSDGTKMIVLSQTNNAVYQYNLSSAWDISTASYSSYSFGTGQGTSTGLAFSSSGEQIFFIGQTSDVVNGTSLSTAWDLAGAQYYLITGLGDNYTFPLSSDGLNAITAIPSSSFMRRRPLSIAWNIGTTGATNSSLYTEGIIGYIQGRARYRDDGTSVYMNSPSNNAIYQWNLGTAFAVGTSSYTGNSFSFTSQDTNARGFAFSDDGTKLYMVGGANDTVYQYALSTAWDISTVSYSSLSVSIAAQETSPQAVFLGKSGTRMYIIGDATDTVYQYNLSVAWDVSSATYSGKSVSVSSNTTAPRDLFFKDDGAAFYVAGSGAAFQYSIG
jgi:sugar lactone lactonase YvrE